MASKDEDPVREVRGPIASEEVSWRDWGQGRIGGRSRHLTRVFGAYHVGVVIEELAPGHQSSPAHYHLHEEEHVLIIEGSARLRLGERSFEMKAGDYVCFPAGQREGHCLINESDRTCRYLIVGERDPNEVCVYTDSNKIMVRAFGEIYDKSATREYFDGEPTDEP